MKELSQKLISSGDEVVLKQVEVFKTKLEDKNIASGEEFRNDLSNLREVNKQMVKNSIEVQNMSVEVKVAVGKRCNCNKVLEEVLVNGKGDSEKLIALFEHVNASGRYNFQGCKIPVSKLNMSMWRERLCGFQDKVVCDYLEYGFPLDFKGHKLAFGGKKNHKGEREFPSFINRYLKQESDAARRAGPFRVNPYQFRYLCLR